ncbi:MAG: hypothetical protein JXA93_04240 [Anaerolineae bacterium]|nr:hypothetical protein [Anaerolineae bacterium]
MLTSIQTESRPTDTYTVAQGRLERPRYFPRQLITHEIMTLEANYFRQRLRLHNRLLHGWGIVCGATVCPAVNPDDNQALLPWHVTITRGYILGPYGDEILIDDDQVIDLRTAGAVRVSGEYYAEAYDPWCTQPPVDDLSGPLYVAVRYKEVMARLVRAQPAGCGCEETPCEYSRWQDGYEIGILTTCPPGQVETWQDRSGQWVECLPANNGGENEEQNPDERCQWPAYPPCPDTPWVVLAKVAFEADGTIPRAKIDNCACRRIVTCSGFYSPADGYYDASQVAKYDYRKEVSEQLRGLTSAQKELQRQQQTTTHEMEEIAAYLDSMGARLAQLRELYVDLTSAQEGLLQQQQTIVSEIRRMAEQLGRQEAELAHLRERGPALNVEPISNEAWNRFLQIVEDEGLIVDSALRSLGLIATDRWRAVMDLPAHELHGVSADSDLGHWLEGKTIGDVANLSFADIRPSGVEDEAKLARNERRFAQIAEKARRVVTQLEIR